MKPLPEHAYGYYIKHKGIYAALADTYEQIMEYYYQQTGLVVE